MGAPCAWLAQESRDAVTLPSAEPSEISQPDARVEPASSPEAQPVPGSQHFRALFGLIVIWASFYLVAMAQNFSFNRIDIDLGGAGASNPRREFMAGLNVADKAMIPVQSLKFHQTPRREVMSHLLSRVGMSGDADGLELISEAPASFHLIEMPLSALIRTIIDDPTVGFSLHGKTVEFFAQRLDAGDPDSGELGSFFWFAQAELSNEPSVLFPAEGSDLWAIVSIEPPATLGEEPARWNVRAELRRGTMRARGQTAFDLSGKAELDFTIGGDVRLVVQGRNSGSAADADSPSNMQCTISIELVDP